MPRKKIPIPTGLVAMGERLKEFRDRIHTCELNGANSFDYLVALQRNAAALAVSPAQWMP